MQRYPLGVPLHWNTPPSAVQASRVSKGNEKVLLEVVQRLGGPCLLRGGRWTGQAE